MHPRDECMGSIRQEVVAGRCDLAPYHLSSAISQHIHLISCSSPAGFPLVVLMCNPLSGSEYLHVVPSACTAFFSTPLSLAFSEGLPLLYSLIIFPSSTLCFSLAFRVCVYLFGYKYLSIVSWGQKWSVSLTSADSRVLGEQRGLNKHLLNLNRPMGGKNGPLRGHVDCEGVDPSCRDSCQGWAKWDKVI